MPAWLTEVKAINLLLVKIGKILFNDDRSIPRRKYHRQDEYRVKQLKKLGFCLFNSSVPQDEIIEKYMTIYSYACSASSASQKSYLKSIQFKDYSLLCRLINDILTREDIQSTIEGYLGPGYFHRYTACWFTPRNHDVGELASGSQRWHFDHEARRQIKAFIIIGDSEQPRGLTEFVNSQGSARYKTPIFNKYPYPGEEDPGAERLNYTLGDILLLDTSRCLHRGAHDRSYSRIMLTAQFVPFFSRVRLAKRAE